MAGTYKINIQSLRRDLTKGSKQLSNLAYGAALSKTNAAKKELLNNFEASAVTRELAAGPEASEEVLPYGNLFSFIGFDKGADPVSPIRQELTSITLNNEPNSAKFGRGNVFDVSFNLTVPSIGDIADKTPAPSWSIGKNWLKKIEKGISGFEYYLFSLTRKFSNSNSGTAIEIKNKLRSGNFRGVSYLTDMLKKFKENLR